MSLIKKTTIYDALCAVAFIYVLNLSILHKIPFSYDSFLPNSMLSNLESRRQISREVDDEYKAMSKLTPLTYFVFSFAGTPSEQEEDLLILSPIIFAFYFVFRLPVKAKEN